MACNSIFFSLLITLSILLSSPSATSDINQLDATQFVFENKQLKFHVGYKIINGETINHIVLTDRSGKATNDSTFEDSIYQLTSFNGEAYAIQMDGESFVWADQDWKPTNFNFDMLTKIISHDQNLIYCSATFPSKAMMNQGKCMGEGWKSAQNVFWYEVTPVICGDELWVVEDTKPEKRLKQFNRFSGELIKTRSAAAADEASDVCSL